MKAEIKASGCLVICSETELEAYALRKWSDENQGDLNCRKLMFDCSHRENAEYMLKED